ncbi:MAG: hypothetical protein NTZ16_15945, partial [Verrucomicrobia bacterium]|nr:hypothetical protein [Verrucomicrobiota bacterium]
GTLNPTVTEAPIVGSPEQGVVVLPKIKDMNYTMLVRANPNTGTATFDPLGDFVNLPGGDKKFGAAYDAVSGKFFILSNPVLPAHANDSTWGSTPNMIRNTAAVLTSRDLYNWQVEKIFLYTPNIDYEAFQYFNFDFDDTNMVIASRTAFDVKDSNKPPRGHDSNLVTFHRLPDFRHLGPTHVLQLDAANNRVLRFETTQHSNAPLGNFTLGSAFAGTNLTAPNGFAQDTNTGTVYIRETGGRILTFDPAGNFLDVVASSPVAWKTSGLLAVTQPPEGECTWSRSGSGDWTEHTNWFYWGRADTATETAVFGSAATAAATVTIENSAREWLFPTNGNLSGWNTNAGLTNPVVSGGVFSAAVASNDPQLYRNDQVFWGSRHPEVRIRFRAANFRNSSSAPPAIPSGRTTSSPGCASTRSPARPSSAKPSRLIPSKSSPKASPSPASASTTTKPTPSPTPPPAASASPPKPVPPSLTCGKAPTKSPRPSSSKPTPSCN